MGNKKQIGVCITSLHEIAVHRVVNALCDEAKKRGYDLHIFAPFSDLYENSTNDNAQKEIFKFIKYNRLDALIIFQELIRNKEQIMLLTTYANLVGIPVICVKSDMPGVCRINYDSEGAIKEIIEHLITKHDCKTINFISGIAGNDISERRIEAYKEVLAKHGIEFENERILYGGFWEGPTREALDNYFSSGALMPQAFVCANDSMALATIKYLKAKDISVPEQVIVTGMGGIKEREYHFPMLTTGIYDPALTAEYIFNAFEELISGARNQDSNVLIPCKIVLSESCGCEEKNFYRPQQTLEDVFGELEFERGYFHEVNGLIGAVNQNCNIETFLDKLSEYVVKPGITSYNLYLKTEYAQVAGVKSETIDNSVPLVWLSNYKNGDNTKLLFSLDWEKFHKSKNLLRADSAQLISIPLTSEDAFYGFITIAYHSELIHRELLYELSVVMSSSLDSIVKRYNLDYVNRQLQHLSEQTIQSLAEVVEAKSEVTGQHVKRVSEYTRILAAGMGYSSNDVNDIRIASMIHDIGKICVPSEVLEKKGALSPQESALIKSHVTEGAKMLEKAPGKIMELAKKIALQHHEKWDGTGYLGLKGETICPEARMVALADVFDALVSVRPYKGAFSVEDAYKMIVADSGKHFAPDVVECFKAHFDEFVKIHNSYIDVF